MLIKGGVRKVGNGLFVKYTKDLTWHLRFMVQLKFKFLFEAFYEQHLKKLWKIYKFKKVIKIFLKFSSYKVTYKQTLPLVIIRLYTTGIEKLA